jgi:PKD repeat protein
MKKLLVMFLIFVIGFVSASVDVHNYTIDGSYYPFDVIKGEINLTIVGEGFFSKVTSNDDDEMSLSDFLILNGVDYDCSPPDCSNDYNVLSGSGDEVIGVSLGEVSYGGFVLNGDDVIVTGVDFDIESDFGEMSNRPIEIDFFEGEGWRFNEFSDSYSPKNWGCYDIDNTEVGPPIRRSTYCEMIKISDSGSLFVGAYVNSGDNVDLKMVVYPEQGGAILGSCLFSPGVEDGCKIDAGDNEIFYKGSYQVCVEAPNSSVVTNYLLYQDTVGENCGFVYSVGPWDSVEDYAIFAREAKFSSASYFDKNDIDFSDLVSAADELVVSKYGRDCSGGCVLPFAIIGVSQNVRISNINVDYFDGGRDAFTQEVNGLEILPTTVDFSGVLDLEVLNFDIFEDMRYDIFLGGEVILSEDLEVLPAPIVASLFPMNPPAGVPVEFYVSVDFDSNVSLTYVWDFGDGSSLETTSEPNVVHSYASLGNYSLKVRASAGNLSSEKVFVVDAISPVDAVDVSLSVKNDSLSGVVDFISGLSFWYEGALREVLGLDFFVSEIDRLFEKRSNASGDDVFVEIATDLYGLNIPISLIFDDSMNYYLLTDLADIHPEVVSAASGESGGGLDSYRDPILNWQTQNVDVNFSVEEVLVSWWNGDSDVVLRAYSFDVLSYEDGESYFVINKPISDLVFRSGVGAKGASGATVVVLEGGRKKSFDFYYEGAEKTSFFVSPRLSTIVIGEDIDTSCNYNLVCEEGEDSETCRSDCKPVFRAVFYGILGLVVMLIFYMLLVVWYKRRYEEHLFGDRRKLYNLLMYVTNARARGMEYSRIAANLRAQGWSSERVRYVIRKARGKRTGMVEIIPISLIGAWIRNRRARLAVTGTQQQIGRNINKSQFR